MNQKAELCNGIQNVTEQTCLKEAAAPAKESLTAATGNTLIITENYIFGQDPEILPDDDPRKGTMNDPNLQDRAWVNRNFTFNLKRR